MHLRLKKLAKFCLVFAAWIFCLSIRVGDKTVFAHAHAVLVDNKIVSAIDEEINTLWQRITMTARVAYGRVSPSKPEPEIEAQHGYSIHKTKNKQAARG